MKRTLRKYVSTILLLCLAVQLAPFGLIHSHDDHQGSDGIHLSHADHADVSSEANDFDHNSNFQFDSDEACDFCEVLHALNDQSYVDPSQALTAVFNAPNMSSTDVLTSKIGEQVGSTQGRAPPKS